MKAFAAGGYILFFCKNTHYRKTQARSRSQQIVLLFLAIFSIVCFLPTAHAELPDCEPGNAPDGRPLCTQPIISDSYGYGVCIANSLSVTLGAEERCHDEIGPFYNEGLLIDYINCVAREHPYYEDKIWTSSINWKPDGSYDDDTQWLCGTYEVIHKYGQELRGFDRQELYYRVYPSRSKRVECPYGYTPVETDGDGRYPEYCVLPVSSCGDSVGNPFHISTAEKKVHETVYPSTGNSPLEFSLSYSNLGYYRPVNPVGSTQLPGFGDFWRHTYDRRVYQESSSYYTATVTRPDGSKKHFDTTGKDAFACGDGNEELLQTAGGWSYMAGDGTVETYNAEGYLTSIVDAQGRTLTLTYEDVDTPKRSEPTLKVLTRVEDDQGRSLTFSYGDFGRMATMTDPEGEGYQFSFSGAEVLTKVTFPDGKNRRFIYDEWDDVGYRAGGPKDISGIFDENGDRYTKYRYHDGYWNTPNSTEYAGGVGRFRQYPHSSGATVYDAYNTSRSYTTQMVKGVARIISERQPAANGSPQSTRTWDYDTEGNVLSETDFNGNRTCYAYEAGRNLKSARLEGLGNSASCPTDLANYIIPAESLQRKISSLWHPDLDLRISSAQPYLITSWVYNGQPDPSNGGLPASCAPPTALRPDGKPIAVLCKRIEQPTSDATGSDGFAAVTVGTARVYTYTYNEHGRMLTSSDPRGSTTNYSYYTGTTSDAMEGDLESITNTAGHETRFTQYNKRGQVTQSVDPNGVTTEYTYHPRGWVSSVTVTPRDGIGAATTFYDYDGVGQLTKVTLPNGAYLAYTYDAAHRLTGIEDSLGNRITYTLDVMSNRTKEEVFDPSGTLKRTQSQVFDTLSRLKEVHGANGHLTEYQYDANGNRIASTEAGLYSTLSQFDALDRLIKVTDADNGETTYSYDALDRLTSVTDAEGLTTSYSYNAFGDLIQQVSPDTGTTTYTYDAAGNRTSQTDARGITVNYSYDALGRLTFTDYPGTVEDITYHYDGSNYSAPLANGIGRMTGYDDEPGEATLVYDARGNVIEDTRTVLGEAYTITYAYDAADNLIGMTYPSGRTVDYTLDAASRVTGVSGATTVLASDIGYLPYGAANTWKLGNGVTTTRQYDLDYRLMTQKASVAALQNEQYHYDSRNNITAIDNLHATNRNQTFSYDPLSRLTDADGFYGLRHYAYDAVGNRMSETKNSGTYAYQYGTASHQLSNITGPVNTAFSHDATGNTTAKGSQTLIHNNAGRMVEVMDNGNTLGRYTYNALGQRVVKEAGTDQTHYHYNQAGQLIAETDANGLTTAEYVYFNGQPLAYIVYTVPASNGVSGLLGDLLPGLSQPTANIYYFHTDHLGTPLRLTDQNRSSRWNATVEPFGKPIIFTEQITMNLRFPGQYYDQESGLHYNYFRDYDPEIGRYIQSDPIGLQGGINTYAYADLNPLILIDPDGRKPYEFQIWVGGGAGYVIVGGTVYTATMRDLETGKTCKYQIRCAGLGVGLPEFGASSRPVEFDDGENCSDCKSFEGTGYIGGGSIQVGGGISIGGGVKIPNGPLLTNDYLQWDQGAFRVGVSHSVCYFKVTN